VLTIAILERDNGNPGLKWIDWGMDNRDRDPQGREPTMKAVLICGVIVAVAASTAWAQMGDKGGPPLSPTREASVTIGGRTLAIKYSAPSVRNRQIFGEGGVVSKDKTYPVWRAGANAATAFHTDSDLDVGGLNVPKGDYTLYVLVKDPSAWELIINKQTGQWGMTYDAAQDLGRVKMTMSKPRALIETLNYTLSDDSHYDGTLQLEWENHIASVPFTVR
jgi:hypothetical protein